MFYSFFLSPSLEPSLWLFLFLSSQRLTLSLFLSISLSQSFHGQSFLIVAPHSPLPPWFSFIPCCKASPISPTFVQSCSLYLLCTELSHNWTQQPQPQWFMAMVINVLLFSLYLIYGFGNLYSIRLICGFGDLDLVVKIWCCLHVIGLDFDFKCIWVLWIGNLNGFGGFGLRFPWICCLCCCGCKSWFGVCYNMSDMVLYVLWLL